MLINLKVLTAAAADGDCDGVVTSAGVVRVQLG